MISKDKRYVSEFASFPCVYIFDEIKMPLKTI
jgi:hypothetical protein